jgi:cyanophycinase
MTSKGGGTLIAIGGHEDRKGEKVILREVARRVGAGPLVISTVASEEPDGLFEEYRKAFRDLGVKDVVALDIEVRADALPEEAAASLAKARGVFFTGGDQLKMTSQIGDTAVFRAIQRMHREGGVVAGTSAGASVLCETMLVSGAEDESAQVGELVRMAPGLGLASGVLIDQHFAERGRLGRLVGGVAENPKTVGIGIDEDTAVVLKGDGFTVIGQGAVYVIDASGVTASNITEGTEGETLSVFDVRLHVLAAGDRFDLGKRRPSRGKAGGKR